jgi:ribosomal protein L21E
MSTSDLLALRIRQLHKHPEDIKKAALILKKSRMQSKVQFEKRFQRRLQKKDYQSGELVLVRNSPIEASVSRMKTEPRYLGPYQVVKKTQGGAYILQELDGTEHASPYAAFRLLPYISRNDSRLNKLLEKEN